MKNRIGKIAAIISIAAIGLALGGSLSFAGMEMDPSMHSDKKAEQDCEQSSKYTCPMHPEVQSDEPGDCPKCGMKLVKSEHDCDQADVEYTCPMHPEVKSDKPGDCPKCGMKLVKTEKKKEHATMYTCPMHPEVMSDKPGDCPKCGMKLVEKK